MLVFHVATAADWSAAVASGAYSTSTRGVSLEEQGFLHASREDPVGDDTFPHLYGPLSPAAVVEVRPLTGRP